MRRLLILIFIIHSSFAFAQKNIVDTIVIVRQLANEAKTDGALYLIDKIEKRCLTNDNDTTKAVFLELKGQVLHDKQRYRECIPVCKQAVSLFEQLNLRQYEYLDCLSLIGRSYHRLKDYANAIKYYQKAILRSVSANADRKEDYRSGIYLNLGNLYKAQGDTLLAQKCYKRAKQAPNPIFTIDIDDWNYIDWENALWDKVDSLAKEQNYQGAVDVYSEMIKGALEKYGKNDKYITLIYSKAILLGRYLNEYELAQPLFEEVIDWGKANSTYNDDVCGAFCNLALCYAVRGDTTNIKPILEDGFASLTLANNENYPPQVICRLAGNGVYWQRNYSMAIKYYEQYLNPKYKREKGKSYEDIVNQLSVSYIHSGLYSQAKTLLKGFLRTDEKRLMESKSETLPIIYHNLGRSLMLLGNTQKALDYLDKSREMQMNLIGKVADFTLQYIQECKSK